MTPKSNMSSAGDRRPGGGAAATPAALALPRTGVPFQTGVPYQPAASAASPPAAPVPSMMEFAGDSSGYNAGGMGYPGALPGGLSTAYGGGSGSTGVAYDPRRAPAEPSRPASQLPLPGTHTAPTATPVILLLLGGLLLLACVKCPFFAACPGKVSFASGVSKSSLSVPAQR